MRFLEYIMVRHFQWNYLMWSFRGCHLVRCIEMTIKLVQGNTSVRKLDSVNHFRNLRKFVLVFIIIIIIIVPFVSVVVVIIIITIIIFVIVACHCSHYCHHPSSLLSLPCSLHLFSLPLSSLPLPPFLLVLVIFASNSENGCSESYLGDEYSLFACQLYL